MQMKKTMFLVIAASTSVMVSTIGAQTLEQAYDDAFRSDPTFHQARAEYMSNQQAVAEARAVFFPQLSTTGSVYSNYNDQNTNSFAINANQTLFNWSYFKNMSKASSVVKQSVLNLSYSEQELMRRVTQAYLAVVESQALQKIAESQFANMTKQFNAVNERYKLGHATITDLDRVKASRDLYRSQALTARITLNSLREQLAQITGQVYTKFPNVRNTFKLIKPSPAKIDPWIAKAKAQNLNLKAATLGLEIAEKEVGVQRAGYMPSLSASGSYFPEKHRYYDKDFIYGLDVSYDLFQGGQTAVQVSKAKAGLQTAQAQRDSAYLNAVSSVQSAYIGMMEGVNQLAAQKRAVESNRSALKHTEAGYVAGTQTIVDILDQQTALFNVERTYVQGRIAYLNSIVNLEFAAGTLSPDTVRSIQDWLY